MPTKLSVNINKIATLRNARGGNLPNLIQVAKDCERFGAQGITVHPRPDERHIRFEDVYDLKTVLKTELNIEGYPNKKFLALIGDVMPHQCTLVPDAAHVLTSNEGWDVVANFDFLKDIIAQIKNTGARVSLFINADEKQVEAAQTVGADRIEMYTGDYAHQFSKPDKTTLILPYQRCAAMATTFGLGVNAGHDLNLDNLAFFKQHVEPLNEVSIGHALVCDALYFGLQKTIRLYKNCLK